MALDDHISRLIGDIYEGASDAALWNRALEGLLSFTRSRFILVSAVDLKQLEYSSTHWLGPDDGRFLDRVREYEADFFQLDPTLRFGARNPRAGFVSLPMAIAAEGTEYDSHPYVRWTEGELNVGPSVVRYTAPIDGLTLGVSIHPPKARGAHDTTDLRLFGMLFQHVERAVRNVARASDFTSARDALLLIDPRGRVCAISEAAENIMRQGDGLAVLNNRLTAPRNTDRKAIDGLIVSALRALQEGSAGGGIRVPRPSGKHDWILTASPMPKPPAPFEAFRPAVLVRIIDPEQSLPPVRPDLWRMLFRLTVAEARLAEALLKSEGNLREVADTLGIAYGTARVHLRNLFDKMDVRSQSQLIALLLRTGS